MAHLGGLGRKGGEMVGCGESGHGVSSERRGMGSYHAAKRVREDKEAGRTSVMIVWMDGGLGPGLAARTGTGAQDRPRQAANRQEKANGFAKTGNETVYGGVPSSWRACELTADGGGCYESGRLGWGGPDISDNRRGRGRRDIRCLRVDSPYARGQSNKMRESQKSLLLTSMLSRRPDTLTASQLSNCCRKPHWLAVPRHSGTRRALGT